MSHAKPEVVLLLWGKGFALAELRVDGFDTADTTVKKGDVFTVLIHDAILFSGETFGCEVSCRG